MEKTREHSFGPLHRRPTYRRYCTNVVAGVASSRLSSVSGDVEGNDGDDGGDGDDDDDDEAAVVAGAGDGEGPASGAGVGAGSSTTVVVLAAAWASLSWMRLVNSFWRSGATKVYWLVISRVV